MRRSLGVLLLLVLVQVGQAGAKGVKVSALALGDHHTCLLLATGKVTCVGSDTGRDPVPRAPENLALMTGVKAISAGAWQTCVIGKTDGSAFAQCNQMEPAGRVHSAVAGTVQLAVSQDLTCARTAEGRVSCWGGGVIGDGAQVATGGQRFVKLEGADKLALGLTSSRACARVKGGAVRCWGVAAPLGAAGKSCADRFCPFGCSQKLPPGAVGSRASGSLILVGDTPSYQACAAPVEVPELAGAVELALSERATCGVFKDGSVKCVGVGVGAGDAPAGMTKVAGLVFGESFGCARLKDGSVRCFGDNSAGQLGDGKAEGSLAQAKVVKGLSGVVELAAGAAHACARTKTGAVLCWGDNRAGQLGDGTRIERDVPTAMKR